jgi:selenophosphate synthase
MDKLEKIYVLDCAMMNGTVRMNSNYTGYASKELAEEAAEAVNKANENNGSLFSVWTSISEMPIYYTREEVPILNRDKDED